jgi:ATP-dependent RNA helicase DDX23/PRP28
MAPTRELAQQINDDFLNLAAYTRLRSAVVVGGKSAEQQGSIIADGVEVIIGTPGRIEDCLDRRILVLNQCFWVILDEADKMIDYNFEEAINRILSCIPADFDKAADE